MSFDIAAFTGVRRQGEGTQGDRLVDLVSCLDDRGFAKIDRFPVTLPFTFGTTLPGLKTLVLEGQDDLDYLFVSGDRD